MKFVVVVVVVVLGLVATTAVLAGPPDVEGEAEVVGERSSPSDGGADGADGNDGWLFWVPGVSTSLRNIFRTIFTRRGEGAGENGLGSEGVSERGLFPNLFSGSGSTVFDPFFNFFQPENYTVTFRNSTLHVVNYGRVPMLVNKTIEERKGEDGSVYYRVVQTVVGPYENNTDIAPDFLDFDATTTADAEFDVTEPPPTTHHTLTKRWLLPWLLHHQIKTINAASESDKDVPEFAYKIENKNKEQRETVTSTNEEERKTVTSTDERPIQKKEGEETNKEEARRRPPTNTDTELNSNRDSKDTEEELRGVPDGHSYLGDTDVNFMGRPRELNPEAEVFDPELIRRGENEVMERRYSRPIRYSPIRSNPNSRAPIRYEPRTARYSQPISDHHYRAPIRYEPRTARYSQPISDHHYRAPIRYEPRTARYS